MISLEYVQILARYNAWQNRSLYGAAQTLTDEARRQDRGAFFGSIHGTLNHILWGDEMWMSRFAGTPRPQAPSARESVSQHADWGALCRARAAFDDVITAWAGRLSADWLTGDLSWYSGGSGRQMSRPKWVLVTHFFNHQTHHRGQVHAMLTQAGAKPEPTDLGFM